MMGGWTAAIALALQAASADVPAAPGEVLTAPLPPGFKVGFSAAQAGQTIEERVPTAETVEDWTRMITVQRFAGLARLGPQAFLDRLGGLIVQACPGATASPIAVDTAGYAATVRVDCPRNPGTGKPETMFARAIAGAMDLHSVQYAYRAVPTAREAATATAYLASVRLSTPAK